MTAIVVSSRIGVLTRNNIMPFWWKRAQWQLQFPSDVTPECFANMEVIRADYKADDTIRCCPAWSAANKPGRPAKGNVLGACWGTEGLGWSERSRKKLRDARQQSSGFVNHEL